MLGCGPWKHIPFSTDSGAGEMKSGGLLLLLSQGGHCPMHTEARTVAPALEERKSFTSRSTGKKTKLKCVSLIWVTPV